MSRPWRFVQDAGWDSGVAKLVELTSTERAGTGAGSATLSGTTDDGATLYHVSVCLIGEIEVAVLVTAGGAVVWAYR